MKNIFKSFLFLIIPVIMLSGCRAKMSEKRPADFNFVLNYGVGAKNQIDTYNGTFTKDLVSDGTIKTDLKLTDAELDEIYSIMRNINILSYPTEYKPLSTSRRTPYEEFYFKVTINGKTKSINWNDETISSAKKAVKLRDLFYRINEIIRAKEEFKKLPPIKGAYL